MSDCILDYFILPLGFFFSFFSWIVQCFVLFRFFHHLWMHWVLHHVPTVLGKSIVAYIYSYISFEAFLFIKHYYIHLLKDMRIEARQFHSTSSEANFLQIASAQTRAAYVPVIFGMPSSLGTGRVIMMPWAVPTHNKPCEINRLVTRTFFWPEGKKRKIKHCSWKKKHDDVFWLFQKVPS